MTKTEIVLPLGAKLSAVALVLGLTLSCGGPPDTPTLSHIVLVTIDTCRSDRLGCYGFDLETTPNIDQISRDGLRFERARSPVPLTLPAHSTLLTGLLPPAHGVHNNLGFRLSDETKTVAEALADAGWQTGAIVSSYVLDSSFGIAQGFTFYEDHLGNDRKPTGIAERRAEASVTLAIDWLRRHAEGPAFLFLHLFDPHRTYDPPSPWSERFRGHPYEGELAYTDHWIGRLVETLRGLDLYRSSLIILTSDHGEMLGEHDEQTHGYSLYESALRVPLIIKPPGRGSWTGRTITDPVGLEDVTPTIMGFAGLSVSQDLPGIDVRRFWVGGMIPPPEDRYFFSESITPSFYDSNPLRAVVGKGWKYIHDVQAELYNLDRDETEKDNLIDNESELAANLRLELRGFLDSPKAAASVSLNASDRARLQAIGYVTAEVDPETLEFDLDPDLPAARDQIALHNKNSRVFPLIYQGRLGEARRLCEEMLSMTPDLVDAHLNLSDIAAREHRLNEAEAHLRRVLELEPDRYDALNNLGIVYSREGRQEEATRTFKQAIDLDDQRPQALANLGALLFETGDTKGAIDTYRRVLEIEPEHVECLYGLGLALQYTGDQTESAKLFRTALDLTPGHPEISLTIARQLCNDGRWKEAEAVLVPALERADDNPDLLRLAALAAHRNREREKAAALYARALNAKPTDPQLRHEAAVAAWESGDLGEAVRQWRRTIELDPRHPEALNGLAWALATSSDHSCLNPAEAVELAQRACRLTNFTAPSYLDTLAAAHAADGDLEVAVATAQKAMDIAAQDGSDILVSEIKSQLEEYRRLLAETSQPHHEE